MYTHIYIYRYKHIKTRICIHIAFCLIQISEGEIITISVYISMCVRPIAVCAQVCVCIAGKG